MLVEVKWCGICGSDVHGMDGSSGRRQPPLIMGHEASGEIAETGKDVTAWQAGERVTFDSTIYPLHDWFTARGMYNLSDNRMVLGVSPGEYCRHGAFAEYVAVPEAHLAHLPGWWSPEDGAAGTHALLTGWQALKEVANVQPGEMVIIDNGQVRSHRPFEPQKPRFCIFEHVYFSRPDSILGGRSVYETRRQIGVEVD